MTMKEFFKEVEKLAIKEFDIDLEIRKDKKGNVRVMFQVYDRVREIYEDASSLECLLELYKDAIVKYNIDNKESIVSDDDRIQSVEQVLNEDIDDLKNELVSPLEY